MTREEAIQILSTRDKYGVPCGYTSGYQLALDMAIEALSTEATQTDLVQRSDVLEVISDAQDGSGSTYNILQLIFVKVNNLPSCHRCYECDEQFYQQLLEKGMIELPLPQYAEWQDSFNKMCESAKPKPEVTITETDIMYVGENYKV